MITPSSDSVPLGQLAIFSCSAEGNPPPEITWFKSTNQITDETPGVHVEGGVVTISSVSLEDEGVYVCQAVFTAGITSAEASLDVLGNETLSFFPITSPLSPPHLSLSPPLVIATLSTDMKCL